VQSRRSLLKAASIVLAVAAGIAILVIALNFPRKTPSPGIYWGAHIAGATYGYGDPPWDMRTVHAFEADTQKQISILQWGQPWYHAHDWPYGFYPFVPKLLTTVRNAGYIPLVDWDSFDYVPRPQYKQPAFTLTAIIGGKYDSYIRTWADAARQWKYPFFLRFDHEMNGTWYPWSEARNGNSPGQYVRAWRHVHDIFTQERATNVTWIWCVNAEYPGSLPLSELYPGDAYVDWVGIDGYNWGSSSTAPGWQTFSQVFTGTYNRVHQFAPGKPIIIAETSTNGNGPSKSKWIA